MSIQAIHPSDGTDPLGAELPITIRIGPDGKLYFHDITAQLLPVALAMCPDDEQLRRREAAVAALAEKEPQ